jgi:hypothetical protein
MPDLETLSPSAYRAEAPLPSGPLRRVMGVGKRSDGKLVIFSAIQLDEAGMRALDALGPVGFIIVPNGFHRIDAGRYAERYPSAKVLCPSGSKGRVAAVTRVDGTLEDYPDDSRVSVLYAAGTKLREAAMIIRDDGDTTVVVCDAIFNMPHQDGFTGFMLKHVSASSGGPTISRLAKLVLVSDANALATQFEEFAALPNLKRVVVAHHQVIDQDPAGTLRSLAAQLR